MSRPTFIELNEKALIHNVARVKQLCPDSHILAILKANAYGHHAPFVAKVLQSHVNGFGVASVDEAMQLRETGIDNPIVLLGGFFEPEELQTIVEQDLAIVVHAQDQLSTLLKTPLQYPITVWLKLNSNMNRLGFKPGDMASACDALSQCDWVNPPVVLMTHLASADTQDVRDTKQQLAIFFDATAPCSGLKSIGNSAFILSGRYAPSDWVRPGIMLYGVSPFADKTGSDFQLKPVMTLKSKIVATQSLKKGDKVGYSGTWAAPEDMSLGVVAVGYGDGYPRVISDGTPVLIRGVQCPIVGRVSMDVLTVDLRPCQEACLHDEVTLWGEGLPVEIIAKHAGTIAYELLTRITPRVDARVIGLS